VSLSIRAPSVAHLTLYRSTKRLIYHLFEAALIVKSWADYPIQPFSSGLSLEIPGDILKFGNFHKFREIFDKNL